MSNESVRVLIPLLTKALNHAPDADIWETVYDLARNPNSPSPSLEPKEPAIDPADKNILHGLQENWNKPYIGQSMDILREQIRNWNRKDIFGLLFKNFSVIQSSGIGQVKLED